MREKDGRKLRESEREEEKEKEGEIVRERKRERERGRGRGREREEEEEGEREWERGRGRDTEKWQERANSVLDAEENVESLIRKHSSEQLIEEILLCMQINRDGETNKQRDGMGLGRRSFHSSSVTCS